MGKVLAGPMAPKGTMLGGLAINYQHREFQSVLIDHKICELQHKVFKGDVYSLQETIYSYIPQKYVSHVTV